MGGWTFMDQRFRAMGVAAGYVGRDASPSPATGSLRVHRREQEELVDAAFTAPLPHLVRATPDGRLSRDRPAPVRERGTVRT